MVGATVVIVASALVVFVIARRDSPPSVTRFEVGPHPSAVAAAGGLVWIADDATHSVQALDVESGDPVGRPVRVERNPIALAAGDKAVWVAHANGFVARIDTRTRRTGRPIRIGVSITGIAADGGRVWAADLPGNTVVEIDARRSRVVRRIPMERGPVRLAVGAGAIWVTNRENTMTRIDLDSGEAGPVVDVGNGPIGLTVDDGRAWVTNSDDGTVSRINVRTGRALGPPIRVGRGPIAVAVLAGSVWVANQDDGTLSRIDPDSGRSLGEPLDLGVRPRGLVADEDSLWLAGTNPDAVVRVDL